MFGMWIDNLVTMMWDESRTQPNTAIRDLVYAGLRQSCVTRKPIDPAWH